MEIQQLGAALLSGFSEAEIGYLDGLGALRIFRRMARSLLKECPEGEAVLDVLQRVLDAGNPGRDAPGPRLSQRSFSSSDACSSGAQSPTPHKQLPNHESEARYWRRLHGEGEFATGCTLRVLRQDAISKEWVCFMADAKAGGSKPRDFSKEDGKRGQRSHEQPTHEPRCPLCRGKEEATEVLRVWPDGTLTQHEGLPLDNEDKSRWLVRVLRNPFPYMLTPQDLYATPFPGERRRHPACFGDHNNEASNPGAEGPLYRSTNAFGASEVVVESPCHNALIGISTDEQVGHALRAMAARGRALRRNPCVLQLMYFKQYGTEASGSLFHPHMQLCSLPIVSGHLQARLKEHQKFMKEHGCPAVQKLYVNDVSGDHPLAVSRFLHKTEHFVASVPFAKLSRGCIVVAPRRHCPRFEDCSEEELVDLGAMLRLLMACLYRLRDDPSYNLFWQTAPTEHALQNPVEREAVERSFCWTLHIRVPNKASGFGLASGVEVTRQLPEQEARELRKSIVSEVTLPIRTELGLDGTSPPRSPAATLEFPDALVPFMMTKTNLSEALNAFYYEHALPFPDPSSCETFMAGFNPCMAGAEEGEVLFSHASPMRRITLDARSRAAASIPKDAVYFTWSYPAAKPDVLRMKGARSAERAFFEHGGFIYFSESREAVGTTSISPAAFGTSLIFGRPQLLPEDVSATITRQGRFQETTLAYLLCKGATHFAYIFPDEFGQSLDCPHGAFAYKFSDSPAKYFALIRRPYNPEADSPSTALDTGHDPGARRVWPD